MRVAAVLADLVGPGTACAGIIRAIAPDAEIYSVRVLGANLKGRGALLHAGVEWAIADDAEAALTLLAALGPYWFFADRGGAFRHRAAPADHGARSGE